MQWLVLLPDQAEQPASVETLVNESNALGLFCRYEGTELGTSNIHVLWRLAVPSSGPLQAEEVKLTAKPRTKLARPAKYFQVRTEQSASTLQLVAAYLSWHHEHGNSTTKWLVVVRNDTFVATQDFLRLVGCFDSGKRLCLTASDNENFLMLTAGAARAMQTAAVAEQPTSLQYTSPAGYTSALDAWTARAEVQEINVSLLVSRDPPDQWLVKHAADQIASGLRGPVVYTHVPLVHQRSYYPYYINDKRARSTSTPPKPLEQAAAGGK